MKSTKTIFIVIIYIFFLIIYGALTIYLSKQYANGGGAQVLISIFVLPFCLYAVKKIIEYNHTDNKILIEVIEISIYLSFPIQLFFLISFDCVDQFYRTMEQFLFIKLYADYSAYRLTWSAYLFLIFPFLIYNYLIKNPYKFIIYYLLTLIGYMYFIHWINTIS
mgnify:CR=1 FL=1